MDGPKRTESAVQWMTALAAELNKQEQTLGISMEGLFTNGWESIPSFTLKKPTKEEGFKLPHHTLLKEMPVFLPLFLQEDGDRRFEDLFDRWPEASRGPIMSWTDPATVHDHPSVKSMGSTMMHGGWHRKFDDSSMMFKPLSLGARCSVRTNAKVGPALLGHRVVIGSSCTSMRIVMGSDAEMDDASQATDAILGERVYIGPGAILQHKPLNPHTSGLILMDFREEQPTSILLKGIHKLGPRIGDDCRIGALSVIEAGTVLFPKIIVPNGAVVPSGIYQTQRHLDYTLKSRR